MRGRGGGRAGQGGPGRGPGAAAGAGAARRNRRRHDARVPGARARAQTHTHTRTRTPYHLSVLSWSFDARVPGSPPPPSPPRLLPISSRSSWSFAPWALGAAPPFHPPPPTHTHPTVMLLAPRVCVVVGVGVRGVCGPRAQVHGLRWLVRQHDRRAPPSSQTRYTTARPESDRRFFFVRARVCVRIAVFVRVCKRVRSAQSLRRVPAISHPSQPGGVRTHARRCAPSILGDKVCGRVCV